MPYRMLAEAIELFESADCHRAEDRAVAERYLAALAPVLARATLGQSIIAEIQQVERLFGHSWLEDAAPFEAAFAKWREFRDEYERFAVGGMTVNERLNEFALTEAYDRATAARDADAVRRVLERVYVDDASIATILARLDDDQD
jgi:hypothetical protein